MLRFQRNFYPETRLVGPIYMHIKEFLIGSHLWKGSMRKSLQQLARGCQEIFNKISSEEIFVHLDPNFCHFIHCNPVIFLLFTNTFCTSRDYLAPRLKLMTISGCDNSKFLLVPDWYSNDYYLSWYKLKVYLVFLTKYIMYRFLKDITWNW
jgi:hypothetical protein